MVIKLIRVNRLDELIGRFMDLQDIKYKGDSEGNDKIMMSFMIFVDLKKEFKECVVCFGISVLCFIVDGV